MDDKPNLINTGHKVVKGFKFAQDYQAREKANLDKFYQTHPKIEKPPKTGLPWWQRLVLILMTISVLLVCSCASVYFIMGFLLLR